MEPQILPSHIVTPTVPAMKPEHAEWPGMALGLIGAVLVAQASPKLQAIGFSVWLASNALLITGAYWRKAWPLALMFAFYFFVSGWGLYQRL